MIKIVKFALINRIKNISYYTYCMTQKHSSLELKELEDKSARSTVKRKEPKLDELREVLNEVMKEENTKKSGILRPGDKIKFE